MNNETNKVVPGKTTTYNLINNIGVGVSMVFDNNNKLCEVVTYSTGVTVDNSDLTGKVPNSILEIMTELGVKGVKDDVGYKFISSNIISVVTSYDVGKDTYTEEITNTETGYIITTTKFEDGTTRIITPDDSVVISEDINAMLVKMLDIYVKVYL